MKTLRISLALMLISICGTILADNPHYPYFKDKKEKVTYKGEQYTITRGEGAFIVTNKKYDFPKGSLTKVLPLPGEYDENLLRERAIAFNRELDRITYSVFTPEQSIELRNEGGFQHYYFKTKTGDYFGISFIFDNKFKDIVTIDKIYEMEQKLLKSNIKVDISKLNLDKSNKKYFLY